MLPTAGCRSLTTGIVDTRMAQLSRNAEVSRELTLLLAQIDLYDRSIASKSDDLATAEAALLRKSRDLLDLAESDDLQAGLSAFKTDLQRYLEVARSVNRGTLAIEALTTEVWGEIDALEEHLSRWLIELTLADEGTDTIDQVLSLVTGYRESLLQIEIMIAHAPIRLCRAPRGHGGSFGRQHGRRLEPTSTNHLGLGARGCGFR